MRNPHSASIAAAVIAVTTIPALADDQIVAQLPWDHFVTGGPNISDYQAPEDNLDLWVIEDTGFDSDVVLSRFECIGTVYPDPPVVYEVTVQVWDAFPPDGHIVMSSVPGSGHYEDYGQDIMFVADFGGQLLPAGDYWLVWNVSTPTAQSKKIAIAWSTFVDHSVGHGLPNNAWHWNPNGGWGWPDNLKKIAADLDGNGQSGVNFTLYGQARQSCYADFTGDGVLDLFDFLAYLNAFNAGDGSADCTGDGALDLFDFLCFVNAFNAGC